MTCLRSFIMDAMTNTFGGPLEPGHRQAAPLPTTNQSRPNRRLGCFAALILRFTQDDTSKSLFYGLPGCNRGNPNSMRFLKHRMVIVPENTQIDITHYALRFLSTAG